MVALYTRQLAALFTAGIPLVRALRVAAQGPDRALNEVLEETARRISEGESLSHAISRHPGQFSRFYVSLIRLGEATGSLERSFQKLAGYLESQTRQRERLRHALMYPALQFAMCALIVAALVLFVVPSMEPLLTALGVPLPWPTRLLIQFTRLASNPATWLALALLWPIWAYIRHDVDRVETLRLRRAEAVDSIPVLGRLVRLHAQSRCLEGLSLLMESGMPLVDSLTVLNDATENALLHQRIQQARTSLQMGSTDSVADLFERYGVFGSTTAQLVRCAEESGQMVLMLRRSAAILENEAALTTEALLAISEPLIMAAIGLMVAFIVLSAYLPLVDVLSSL